MLRFPSNQAVEDRARMALRNAVCRQCSERPAGSESLGCDVPRSCEARCRLFRALPRLCTVARCIDPMIGSFDRVMDHQVRQLCSHGDIGGKEAADPHDPLACHRNVIVRELKNIVGK